MGMNWDHLRTFHAIATTGSLSAAGRMLKASQPTVGRQLAALEAQIGQKLFQRRRHGMTLTPTGESILAAVKAMDKGAEAAERRLMGTDVDAEGSVRISVTEGLGIHFLPYKLLPFRRINPGIRFDFSIANTAADLDRREADIAIRLFRPTGGDLIMRRAGRMQSGLFASTTYLKAHGTPQSAADLASHEMIGFDNGMGSFPQNDLLAKLNGSKPYAFRSNSLLAQMEAARAGYGIALMNCYSGKRLSGLRQILAEAVSPAYDVWLVVHRDLRRVPRIAMVYEELARIFLDSASELGGSK